MLDFAQASFEYTVTLCPSSFWIYWYKAGIAMYRGVKKFKQW